MRDLLLASDSPGQLFKPIRTLPIVIFLLISDVSHFLLFTLMLVVLKYSPFC